MIKIESIINFNVSNQTINAPITRIVSDSINIVKAVFVFDSKWDGYIKTAVFTNGDVKKSVLLNTDSVTVPWECLKTGALRISVIGIIEEPYSRITTKEMGTGISIVQCGDLTGGNATEPTATVLEQLTAKIDSANTNADTAFSTVNSLQNTISSSVETVIEKADVATEKATEATAQAKIAINIAQELSSCIDMVNVKAIDAKLVTLDAELANIKAKMEVIPIDCGTF